MLRALRRENNRAFCDGEGFHSGGNSLAASSTLSPAAAAAAAFLSWEAEEGEPRFVGVVLASFSLSRPFPFPLPLAAFPEVEGEEDGFLPFPFACSS